MKTISKPLIITAMSLAACAVSQPAFAQNSDEHFEGPAIGVQAGYSRSRVNEAVLSGANSVTLDDRNSGVSYSGYVGYDAQFGQFVLGVEAGFSPSGRTLTGDITGGGTVELKPKWSADVSARAGVVLADRALVYGRVGYNRARYGTRTFASGGTTAIVSQNTWRDGLLLGGGVEYAVTDQAALRVEYRRNDLGGSLRTNQILAGATIRF